jgi:FMN phosphatase YigB (HAD superfamily)
MPAVRCLLLDLGQVVIGIDFSSFARRMQDLTGLEAEQLRDAITRDGLPRNYEVGLLDDAEFHAEVCLRVKTDIPRDVFLDAWNSIFVPTPLLCEEMILTLARRNPLWALSNTNRIHSDFVRANYPVLRYFTGFVLSHEVHLAKPDPAIFRLALDRAGVEPDEALFVDDLAVNVEAAQGLGIDAFQFLNLDQFVGELKKRGLLPEDGSLIRPHGTAPGH